MTYKVFFHCRPKSWTPDRRASKGGSRYTLGRAPVPPLQPWAEGREYRDVSIPLQRPISGVQHCHRPPQSRHGSHLKSTILVMRRLIDFGHTLSVAQSESQSLLPIELRQDWRFVLIHFGYETLQVTTNIALRPRNYRN